MKAYDLIRQFKSHKEIKSNIDHYTINGDHFSLDDDIDVNPDGMPVGEFLYYNIENNPYGDTLMILFKVFDFRDFFGDETNIKSMGFFTGYTLLSLGKKEEYVFMNN